MAVSEMSAIDARVMAFERAMAGSLVPDFDAYLPPPGDPARGPAVCELARVDLELRWTRGERPDLDRYLSRYPELADPAARAEVAFEDYRQRLLAGDRPSRDGYASRYGVDVAAWPGPEAATDDEGPATKQIVVRADADLDGLLSEATVDTRRRLDLARRLPEVGETVLGFRLVRELGRGAFGRVYLAEQTGLADRRVAVKLSTALAAEIRTLARLQHTNIVPVYSAHSGPAVQALCMPFFGGTTLARALTAVRLTAGPRTGKALADAVRRGQSEAVAAAAPLRLLDESTFVDAILWVGERLADALAHAHARGVVHRDIKPANVLLADDGQPMLLDFNLALETMAGEAETARVGGTLPYMAPEYLGAFAGGPRSGPDGRADVYALGVVLFEALAGRPPFPARTGETHAVLKQMHAERSVAPPALRPLAADVSPAAEAIVLKCLAPDPADRYQSAADLRDDLARQRAHLPLKHVAEPSLRERLTKWGRRNRFLASPAALAAYAAALLMAGTALGVRLSLDARAARQDHDRAAALQNYEAFLSVAEQVRQAAGSPSGSADVLRLSGPALDRYAATTPGWEDGAEVTRLPAAARERLTGEVGEVAYLAARAAARTRHDADLADRLRDLATNTLPADARTILDAEPADGTRAAFLRALDLAADSRHAAALPLVAGFVARFPDDFGGWFLKAQCHAALGQYADARAGYATCAALRPTSAETFAARGELALKHDRDLDQARADLDRALALDPARTDARITRAVVLRLLDEPRLALTDLDRLLAAPDVPTRVYFLRARVRDTLGDQEGAAADRAAGMKEPPRDPASFVTRGLAQVGTDVHAALADFRAAERLDPNYPEALENQAWLYGEKLKRPADALAAVDRLLATHPDHQNALGGRAVYLTRLGRPTEAVAVAERLLAGSPQAAAFYQAGCVYALLSETDPAYRADAVRLIATALFRGFGHDLLATDPDLDPLRADPNFRTLAEGVRAMIGPGAKK